MKVKTLHMFILMVALAASGCEEDAKQIEVQLENQGVVAVQPDDPLIGADPANPQGTQAQPETPTLPTMTTQLSEYPLSTPTDDVLVLVNKTHPLTRDYVPPDLVTVEHCDPNVGTADTKKMRKIAADAIEELIAGAKKDGIDIVMRTGYRSYDYQANLFANYAASYGEAEANTYSARAGQSEHQSGWCCDVGVLGRGLTSFDGSPEAAWVEKHCWEYGFILRYPQDKTAVTGYIYESWHIRYVGKDAAKYIYDNALTLEEYLGILD